MEIKTHVVFILISLPISVICHNSVNQTSVGWKLNIFKPWIRQELPPQKSKTEFDFKDREDFASDEILFKTEIPNILSSLRDHSESLDRSDYDQLIQRPSFRSGCSCQIGTMSSCFTQCTSEESRCGRTCLHITEYSVTRMLPPARRFDGLEGVYIFSTFQTTVSSGCDLVTRACILSTVVGGAAIAAAVGVGVALGVGALLNAQEMNNAAQQQELQVSQDVQEFLSTGGLLNSQIPHNVQAIPVSGTSLPDGGCGDNLVPFPDGNCYPVLRRGPCGDPFRWVTVDPKTLLGRCSPRLCGRGRAFVGRDELCHDVNDPLECRGGRRLYYSAYGDPLCDCPIGQYPFPTEVNDCVPLFTRGPCMEGQVVGFEISGALACVPSDCPSSTTKQLVRNERGECIALGSLDTCSSPSQFYGYDVFRNRGICVDTSDENSPYSLELEQDLDQFYNQMYPVHDDYQFILIRMNRRYQKARRKQDSGGVFRFPTSVPDTLLNPCRPGERSGNNFKCTNPLVSRRRRSGLLQAVRSAFRCPADEVLQANGLCTTNTSNTSCGPSYQFIKSIGQCRQIILGQNEPNQR